MDTEKQKSLLDRWDEYQARGEEVTPEELCREYPELLPDIRKKIAAIKAVDEKFAVAQSTEREGTVEFVPTAETTDAVRPVIPGYEILDELGRGGMGVVYKAKHLQLNRVVALKMILIGRLAGKREIERFQSEAKAAAKLDHPNIVPIFEVGEHDGQPYFSMGYVDGESLAHRIADDPMEPHEAVKLVGTLCEAIAYAHKQGVIHRDLKPANVMLAYNARENSDGKADTKRTGKDSSRDGPISSPAFSYTPKITDFGLAKRTDDEQRMTTAGQILGTPSYMPPEQATGEIDQIFETADVYSLGAILYRLLVGRPPFQASSSIETLRQVLETEPVPPRQINPAIPRDLETICLKCLEKNHRQRYPSATAMGLELQRYSAGEPIQARPVSRAERVWRWCCRYPAIASMGAALALAMITGSIVSLIFAQRADTRAWEAQQSENKATQLLTKVKAERQKATRLAEEKSRTVSALQHKLRIAELHAAETAIEAGDMDQAIEILDRSVPAKGEFDYRGFAWHFLRDRCRFAGAPLLTVERELYDMVLSPDATAIAVASGRRVELYRLATGDLIWSAGITGCKVYKLAFTGDGSKLLAACGFGEGAPVKNYGRRDVRVYDVQTGKLQSTNLTNDSLGACVAVSPKENIIACGATGGAIELWDYALGKKISRLEGHGKDVERLAYTPKGDRLISAAFGESVRVWDVRDVQHPSASRVLQKYKTPYTLVHTYFKRSFWRYYPVGLAVDPHGHYLAVAANGPIVELWDLKNYRKVGTLKGHTDAVASLTFSRDGKRLVSGGLDGDIRIWDVRKARLLARLPMHRGPVCGLVLSSEGKTVYSGADNGEVRKWMLPKANDLAASIGKPGPDSRSSLYAVAISPDGKTVATSGWMYCITLRDSWTGEITKVLGDIKGRIHSLAFRPDGKRIAAAIMDERTLGVWDVETGNRVVRQPLSEHVETLSVAPDGRHIAVNGQSTIYICNAVTGTVIRKFHGIWSSYSPDGKSLAVAREGEVEILEAKTLESQLRIPTCGIALQPAFSPSGRLLAFAESRKEIVVCDLQEKAILHRISGHFAAISMIAFCPDGRSFATPCQDGRARIWDLVTGEEQIVLHPSDVAMTRLAFSRDGRLLATCGLDKQVCFWRAPTLTAAAKNVEEEIISKARNFNRVKLGNPSGYVEKL